MASSTDSICNKAILWSFLKIIINKCVKKMQWNWCFTYWKNLNSLTFPNSPNFPLRYPSSTSTGMLLKWSVSEGGWIFLKKYDELINKNFNEPENFWIRAFWICEVMMKWSLGWGSALLDHLWASGPVDVLTSRCASGDRGASGYLNVPSLKLSIFIWIIFNDS